MPKVAYSHQERAQVRQALVTTALQLMARQGVQHTTVEQIYQAVGISRTFFYSFFSSKEDLIVETFYLQQPKIRAFAQSLMDDPALSWREGVERFFYACCYGERNGIAVMTLEEQQWLFRRLSKESYLTFREKQALLFGDILHCFGVPADQHTVALFTNICLAAIVIRRAIPASLPMLVPEARDETVAFQISAMVDWLEGLKTAAPAGD